MRGEKGRILVVDDHPKWRKLLKDCLAVEGYEVDTAADSAEAKLKLKAGDFLVVTIDMNLDESDEVREGRGLLKYVQKNCRGTQCIVVSGSDLSRQEVRDLFKKYDVYDFMEKGAKFDSDDFVHMVEKALQQASSLSEGHTESLNDTRKEIIKSLQSSLNLHRKNLSRKEEDAARYGMAVPTHIQNEIDHEKKKIKEIEEQLEELRTES